MQLRSETNENLAMQYLEAITEYELSTISY